jgi:hypothetical protein
VEEYKTRRTHILHRWRDLMPLDATLMTIASVLILLYILIRYKGKEKEQEQNDTN